MSASAIIRVNFLILALFLVIMAMSSVKQGSLEAGINKLFGVPETQSNPARR